MGGSAEYRDATGKMFSTKNGSVLACLSLVVGCFGVHVDGCRGAGGVSQALRNDKEKCYKYMSAEV